MARNTRIFSDLDFNFTAHPVTKDLTRRYDENAIKTALKNLILTSNFERPFHSEIGSPIRRMLFEPATPLLAASLKQAVINTINSFEPRVELTNVAVSVDEDSYTVGISIEFRIINTTRPITLDLTLERTR
jgi:phage baseplate assembly protein W